MRIASARIRPFATSERTDSYLRCLQPVDFASVTIAEPLMSEEGLIIKLFKDLFNTFCFYCFQFH